MVIDNNPISCAISYQGRGKAVLCRETGRKDLEFGPLEIVMTVFNTLTSLTKDELCVISIETLNGKWHVLIKHFSGTVSKIQT